MAVVEESMKEYSLYFERLILPQIWVFQLALGFAVAVVEEVVKEYSSYFERLILPQTQ